MKVRILSGNLTGQIVEQTPDEAGNNIAMGFAEAVPDEPETAPKPRLAPPRAPLPPVDDEPTEEPEEPVDQLTDISGHGRHLTQADKAKQPRKVKK